MAYIDGYVIPVKTARKADYLAMAHEAAELFKKYGALKVVETWEDNVPQGVVTSFPMAVKQEEDESLVFSWVWWADKASRDKGMADAMNDPWFAMTADMPFDGKRMIFGGFEVILER